MFQTITRSTLLKGTAHAHLSSVQPGAANATAPAPVAKRVKRAETSTNAEAGEVGNREGERFDNALAGEKSGKEFTEVYPPTPETVHNFSASFSNSYFPTSGGRRGRLRLDRPGAGSGGRGPGRAGREGTAGALLF